MDLNAIWIFTRVVQAGSFSGAARLLNMPKSTVSLKVAQLEEALGVTLLKRTTRKLHLTEAGENYFNTCSRALAEIREADTGAAERSKPQGLLRVTAPVEMGSSVLIETVASFVKRYPEVDVELVLTDRIVDLVAEDIDVAIRAGQLDSSSLIARKLGVSRFQLFATAAYLKKNGTPEVPRDLENHSCLAFTPMSDWGTWKLNRAGKTASVRIKGRILANNLVALKSLMLADQGIALLPAFLCKDEADDRKVTPVLPGWTFEQEPIHAVYPAQRFVPAKVRVFMEHIGETLKVVF